MIIDAVEMNKKLSIVTINFNNLEGLRKTIESVIGQTFTDYEWIVIDGGSTDGSKELIETYQEHFSYWVSEPDTGIYNAMNKGILHAHGEWLQFLNSGDGLYNNDVLKNVFSDEHWGDVLYGNTDFVSKDGNRIVTYPESISFTYFKQHVINHQSSFYKREIFNEHLYDENYQIVSDWAYCFTLILRDKRFEYINLIITNFDTCGKGSIKSEKHQQERSIVLANCTPYHLKQEIQELERYREMKQFIAQRKSFTALMNCCYRFCRWIDPFLLKIDRVRHRND